MFSTTAKVGNVGSLSYRSPLRKVATRATLCGLPNLLPTRLTTGKNHSSTRQQGLRFILGLRSNVLLPGKSWACQSLRWSSSSSSSSSCFQQTTLTSFASASTIDSSWYRQRVSYSTNNLFLQSLTMSSNHRISVPSQSLPIPLTRYYSSSSSNCSCDSGNTINSLVSISRQQRQPSHSMTSCVSYRAVTIRNLSTGGKEQKDSTGSSPSPPPSTDSTKTKDTASKSSTPETNDSTSSRMAEASKAVRQRVEQVEERLSKVLHDVVAVSTGDQLAVAAIAVLLIGLVAAPYVISQMKASNRNYDYLADTDDPVDDFTQLAKEEWDSPDATRVSALENILSELVQSKALQQAAKQFVLQLVEAPEVKAALQRLLMSLWKDLVEDPETVKQVINLLAVAIADEQVKVAAQKLVLDLVAETEVQASLVAAVQKLGVDAEVQTTLQTLLTSTAHNTLNDAEVLDHSMEFATDVLGDDVVQQTAGEALRNTVRHAFKPAATMGLTATGVGLMLFGILALGYARSSEHEARLLDTAARSLQTNAAYGLQRLITWPARAFGGSLAWLQQAIVNAWSTLTTTLARNIGRLGQGIVKGLAHTCKSLGTAFGQSWQSILGSTWRVVGSVWDVVVQAALGQVHGALQFIQYAWAASNTSLLRWSWNVVLWGRQFSWRIFSWIPRSIGRTTIWRSLHNLWQSLVGRFVGLS